MILLTLLNPMLSHIYFTYKKNETESKILKSTLDQLRQGLESKATFRVACCRFACMLHDHACNFRVAALSGHATLAFSQSSIAHRLKRIQLCAVCRFGQSGRVIWIGKTLLTAWSSLCGKWHLRSCANITIKAVMW